MKIWDKFFALVFSPVFLIALILLAIFIWVRKRFEPNKGAQHKNEKSNLRYPVEHYLDIADRLDDAMNSNYGLPGTDEDRVFRLLDGLNKDELIEVKNRFGKRVLSDTEFSFLKGERDLFGWFEEEFSGGDLQRLKSLWVETGLWN